MKRRQDCPSHLISRMRSALFCGSSVFLPWLLEISGQTEGLMKVISLAGVLERKRQAFATRWLNVESESESGE